MKKVSVLLVAGLLWAIPALVCGSPYQTKDQPSAAAAEKKNTPAQQISHRLKTGRAYLEGSPLLAGSTIEYWIAYSKFKEDWQFKFS